MKPSLVHILTVAAARLQEDHANPELVKHMREAAKRFATMTAQGRGRLSDDEQREADQRRNLFTFLPPSGHKDRLLDAMLQRAYDLLSEGNAAGCDAILEFVPSAVAEKMLDAWCADQEGKEPKSKWH